MKRLWLLPLGVCLLALACGDFGDSTSAGRDLVSQEILDAVPDPELFTISLPTPDAPASGLTFWRLTRGQATQMNSAIAETLRVMNDIRPYPPAQTDSDGTVWELQTPIGQSTAVAPRLAVSRESEGRFRYSLSHRNIELGSSWIEVFKGEMTLSADQPRRGNGEFELNYTALTQADSDQWRRGLVQINVTEDEEGDFGLFYSFTDYLADVETGGEAKTFVVDYLQKADGYGHFHYPTWFNWIGSEMAESFVIHNRWNPTGSGVTQVVIRGEEITSRRLNVVEIRECWSTGLNRTYYVQINYWRDNNGDPTEPTFDNEKGNPDACVFPFEPLSGF